MGWSGDAGSRGAWRLISLGNAINGSGQVTGSADTTAMICTGRFSCDGGDPHAFLWDGAVMDDLNTLVDPSDPLQPFVTLTVAKPSTMLGRSWRMVLIAGRTKRTPTS